MLDRINIKTFKPKNPFKQKDKDKKEAKWVNKSILLFLVPSLIGVTIFTLIPFLDVIIRSFQNEVTRDFVFLDNYIDVFNNDAFKLAGINTIKFVLVCIPLLLGISLLLAVLINDFFKASEKLTTAFLVPMAIPIASVVLVWNIVFHETGLLNGFLVSLEVSGVDWMNTGYAFWILVFTYIWKNVGYTIILWMAGLSCIPKEIYEAARVDGASRLQSFRRITFPMLKPTVYTITVISLLNSFKVFREAYLIAGSYPNESMYMLQHIFNNWFRDLAFGKISAGSVVMSLIIFLLIVVLQKSWERES
ncbi:MAG: sugar ABC transporter permease [Clostridium sp.]